MGGTERHTARAGRSRLLGFALLGAGALGSVAALAAEPPASGAGGLSVPPRLSLTGIHSTELAAGDVVARGPGAVVVTHGLETTGPSPPDIATVVEREVADLWQIYVPATMVEAALDVTYEMVSASGRHDRLSHDLQPDSEIRVRVRPMPPTVIGQEGELVLVQGGVVLELDVASAVTAGTYLGTLTATVSEL